MMYWFSFTIITLAVLGSNGDEEFETCTCDFKNCHCVPYYLCTNDSIITDGGGLLDLRNIPQRAPQEPAENEKRGECGLWSVCCTSPAEKPVIEPEPHHSHKCGNRNKQGLNTRILNFHLREDEAQFGEYPWQCAILREEGKINVFVCGASLIGNNAVATAAHCVNDADVKNLKIRCGEYDTQSSEEIYPHLDVGVKSISIHPEFNRNNAFNDLALLFFNEPIDFKPNIDSICLPDTGDDFVGKECVVTGWGKNAFDATGGYQRLLKAVNLPVIPNDTCQKQLRKTRLGPMFRLYDGFMCAGGEEGKDACKGDGGGPLACEYNGVYKLAGIVAWGIGCGQKEVPGVYVKVSNYAGWIQQEAKAHGTIVD
uniref:Scol-S1 n=1 Tax=Scolopendra viridis TaxID=118503 RepID=A0A4D5R981_SCOVI